MPYNQLIEKSIGGLHSHLEKRLSQIQLPLDAPILDIGCGSGAWLNRLSHLGYKNLYGLDIDRSSFKLEGINFVESNIDYEKATFGTKFSLITAIEVIEHLENPGNFCRFIAESLAPNGILLLTTPNIHSLTCKTRFLITGNLSQFDPKGDVGHIYPVVLYAFRKIMARYDLEIFDNWCFPELGGTTSSRTLTRLGAKLIRTFIKDDLPSDNLCLFIRFVDKHKNLTTMH